MLVGPSAGSRTPFPSLLEAPGGGAVVLPDPVELRKVVERHFRVYEVRSEKLRGVMVAHAFCLMYPKPEFEARYEAAQAEILKLAPESLVFVRTEGGEDILYVAERPQVAPTKRGLRLGMFIATLATTVAAGAISWASYVGAGKGLGWMDVFSPAMLIQGFLTFALPLLLILGLHEAAHFVAAKRHRLRATLPLFIPAPPLGAITIGTFGAFISLKDPLPNRKALFDVGASGPLAGFVVALPILIIGAMLTNAMAVPIPDLDRPDFVVDVPAEFNATQTGVTTATLSQWDRVVVITLTAPNTNTTDAPWPFTLHAKGIYANGTAYTWTHEGKLARNTTSSLTFDVPAETRELKLALEWNDGLIRFGDPLLFTLVRPFVNFDGYLTHPTFFAGWVGLLVTGINLLPVGQLDGGHVARALLGNRMRPLALAAVGMLFVLAVFFSSWGLMALFVILMGIEHPPPLNDRSPLDTKRKVLGIVMLAILILTFVPVPISF